MQGSESRVPPTIFRPRQASSLSGPATGTSAEEQRPQVPGSADTWARAATVIQSHVRAHLCRRRVWDQAHRLIAWLGQQPGMAGMRAPRSARKRAARGPTGESVAPHLMNDRQRLQRLRQLYAPQWAQAEKEVDNRHPQVLAHFNGRDHTAKQLRQVVAQKREDTFAAALPDDACDHAGFFSATKRRLSVRGRTFVAPTGDIEMLEAAPVLKKSRRA